MAKQNDPKKGAKILAAGASLGAIALVGYIGLNAYLDAARQKEQFEREHAPVVMERMIIDRVDDPSEVLRVLSYFPASDQPSEISRMMQVFPKTTAELKRQGRLTPEVYNQALFAAVPTAMSQSMTPSATAEPASMKSVCDAIRGFVAQGADPNGAPNGQCLLDRAVETHNIEVARTLIELGAKVDQPTNVEHMVYFKPPATQKITRSTPKISEVGAGIVMVGYRPDPKIKSGPFACVQATALIDAARRGQDDMVKFLLSKGASPKAKADDGHNAKQYAEHFDHPGTAALLPATS
jgi:hypothetical protein